MNFFDIPQAPSGPESKGSEFGKYVRSFLLAVRSLWLHKLRAFLSVLGIIIASGSVIALMGFGNGSMQDALDDIKQQGATNIVVRSDKPSDDSATSSRSMVIKYGLTMKDLERFRTFGHNITRIVPMRVFASEFRFNERNANGRLVATSAEYMEINKLTLARGRFLTTDEGAEKLNRCVLGAAIADKLFPFSDPLGRSIVIRGNEYLVIGVIGDRMPTGGSGGSMAAEDFNNDVYIPIETAMVRVGKSVFIRSAGSRSGEEVQFSQITMTVDADFDTTEGRMKVKAMGDSIRDILKREHQKEDYKITVPLDKLEEAERAQVRFTSLLAVIGSISGIVGGIGIMNIMLATVTERTREIGIRRALGAKRIDIIVQFLIEAVVQTTLGGLIGVGLGLIAGWVVPPLANSLFGVRFLFVLTITPIIISLGGSIVVGVVAGLYPAWRAALLDPIEALRHT